MRFDTMIDIILRQIPSDPKTQVAAWRQLIDILAQRGAALDPASAKRALHALALLRPNIAESVRRASALSIAQRCRYTPLVAFLGADSPPVAYAIMRNVELSQDDWLDYLPVSNPVSRSALRNRSDLPDAVVRALGSFGALDMRLGNASEQAAKDPDPVPAPVDDDQISDLKRRIATFRARQSFSPLPSQALVESADEFAFETDSDGYFIWTEGAPRSAVIGLSIAEAAFGSEPGVDGSSVGGFRRRADIVNARLTLEPTGALGGEWRFSAAPIFDEHSGQFVGYRGRARRPHHHETAQPDRSAHAMSPGNGDTMRQLIHELRSPLNAISGFAQIIDAQLFGPVAHQYRAMAQTIVDDAARLQSVIDDLDTAAQMSAGPSGMSGDHNGNACDIVRILFGERTQLAPLLRNRAARIDIIAPGAIWVSASEAPLKRMVGRLLAAIANIMRQGEVVEVECRAISSCEQAEIAIKRPESIALAQDSELLDPGYSPDGDAPDAAMLSLGFSLRLVNSLAAHGGGAMRLSPDSISLIMPMVDERNHPRQMIERPE